MFLGYNTNGFAHHRLEDVVSILADLGYRGLALTADFHSIDPLADRWMERARRLDTKLRKARMRVVIETGARFILDPKRKHQPTLLDPDRHASLDRLYFLEACVRLGAALEADAVSFWSGAKPDDSPPRIHMARLVEACLRLSDFAGDRGIRLAFEPEPGMFIDTMDKFAELHGKVNRKNFGLTLDVGHLVCMGETPVGAHIRRWQDWLWNIHIEDMKKGIHEHLMFGEGEVDFSDMFAALSEIGYRRGLYVELSRHSHDAVETAKKAMAFLRRFDPKAAPKQTPQADELVLEVGVSEPDSVVTQDEAERHPEMGPAVALPPAGDEGGESAGQERADDEVRQAQPLQVEDGIRVQPVDQGPDRHPREGE
ncbi:MAG TPA: sugar phosphate isomerase/epimerase family protein [Gemmataceae bacterium]|jgi:sugar phosphate isomerase/epimerase|nr:sugar phosphate isomerase/epimerase family protein [Gemmataceae bacterium]